jgi:hypothetical protein
MVLKCGVMTIEKQVTSEKVLRMPRCAAYQVAKQELGSQRRRGKGLQRRMKYWMCYLHMEGQDTIKICYE